MAWVILITSILLGAFGQIFLKLAVESVTTTTSGMDFYLQLTKNLWLYTGAFSYGLSFLLWLVALRSFDLSFARPLTSIGYVVTYVAAIIFLGEPFMVRRLIGVIVITAGVLLLK
jgi:multidrug transporter EmrE-like cation transporter